MKYWLMMVCFFLVFLDVTTKCSRLLSDDDLAESFCLIPSGDEPVVTRKENVALKSEVARLQEQLAAAQTELRARKENDEALRVKILNARGEVCETNMRFQNKSDLS